MENYEVSYLATGANEAPSPLSYIALMQTKADVAGFANFIINAVKSGEVDALKIWKHCLLLETALSNAKEAIKEAAITEAAKYTGEKNITLSDRKTYNYTDSNDSTWNELNQQLEILKNRLKERETFLKSLKEKTTIVDGETGEISEIWPPTSKATTVLTIKFN
jgi:hypothetical protein